MTIPGMSGASPLDPSMGTPATGAAGAPVASDAPLPLVNGADDNDPNKVKKQKAAKAALAKEIAAKNAEFNQTNLLGSLMGLIMDKNGGNYVVINNIPEGTTLGEIRVKYNLPPGSLRHMVSGGGGDFDKYEVEDGYVYIYAGNLAEGLGISERELKGMFPDSQYSPWYDIF